MLAHAPLNSIQLLAHCPNQSFHKNAQELSRSYAQKEAQKAISSKFPGYCGWHNTIPLKH